MIHARAVPAKNTNIVMANCKIDFSVKMILGAFTVELLQKKF